MSNYDMDQLMGTYADWIAWLKEKEASLEGQLARMKGKEQAAPVEVAAAEVAPVTEAPAAAAESEPPADIPAPGATDDDAADANDDDWL
jgi:hypothetical protein